MISTETQARAAVREFCRNFDLNRLEMLVDQLRIENDRQNLVAKKSLDAVWQRHIADSAQLLQFVEGWSKPWLDLGSGAGFPGLVIAAIRPENPVILVESRKKRVEWLDRMITRLALENCTVIGSRVEAIESFRAGVISARAFAPLPRLLALSARFSTKRTRWLLPKGQSAAQEVDELPKSAQEMFHVEQSATDPQSGIIVGTGRWRMSA